MIRSKKRSQTVPFIKHPQPTLVSKEFGPSNCPFTGQPCDDAGQERRVGKLRPRCLPVKANSAGQNGAVNIIPLPFPSISQLCKPLNISKDMYGQSLQPSPLEEEHRTQDFPNCSPFYRRIPYVMEPHITTRATGFSLELLLKRM